MQVLKTGPSFADFFGKGLDQGLSQTLDTLVKYKGGQLEQKFRERSAKKMAPSIALALQIPIDQAEAVAAMPQHMQTEWMKNYVSDSQRAAIEQMFNGGQSQQEASFDNFYANPQQEVMPQQGMEQLMAQPQQMPQKGMSLFGGSGFPMTPDQERLMGQIAGYSSMLSQPQNQLMQHPQQEAARQADQMMAEQAPQQPQQAAMQQAQVRQPGYATFGGRLSPQMMLEVQKSKIKQGQWEKEQARKDQEFEHKKKTEESRERHKINKETSEYRQKIYAENQSASDELLRNSEMRAAIKKGVMSPTKAWIVKKLGLPEGYFDKNSEYFNKLSIDNLRDLKTYLGSQISAQEMQTFLGRIPTLLMSDEGKKLVLDYLDYYAGLKKTKYDVMQQVIKDNKGIPEDLIDQVETRFSKIRDEKQKEFRGFAAQADKIANIKYDSKGNEYENRGGKWYRRM